MLRRNQTMPPEPAAQRTPEQPAPQVSRFQVSQEEQKGWALSVGVRIAVTLAVPLLALLIAAGALDYQQFQTITAMRQLDHRIDVAAAAMAAIHELQKERGLSMMLKSPPDARAQEAYQAQTRVSADKTQGFLAGIAHLNRIAPWIEPARAALHAVAEQRRHIASGVLKTPDILADFAAAIRTLQMSLTDLTAASGQTLIADPAAALLDLSFAKETAGIERATGAAALTAGVIGQPVRRRILELAAVQNERLTAFNARATPAQRAHFAERMPANALRDFISLRDSLIEGDLVELTTESWFAAATDRIDRLRQMEEHMLADLRANAKSIHDQAWQALLLFNALALLILIAGGAIVWRLVRNITRPIQQLTGAMRALADGMHSTTIPGTTAQDEIGAMARAVLVFREQACALDALTLERERQQLQAEEDRRNALKNMAADIERQTQGVAARVADESLRVCDTAKRMAASAERVSEHAQLVAAAAEQSLANNQAVAGSAEHLTASIRDITRQVDISKQVVCEAVAAAQSAAATVASLTAAMNDVDQVVQVIADIASRTNLLALNATIESARAGAAGRGFAVVAQEVKQLASQTSEQTEDISQRITHLKDMALRVCATIDGTVRSIRHVEEIALCVAQAVDQQDQATQEISRNVSQSAQAADEVADRIVKVFGEAACTGQQAMEVEELLEQMNGVVTELGHVLTHVVRTVTPEVDRRNSPRYTLNIPGKIACPHGTFAVDLTDISLGGAQVSGMTLGNIGNGGVLCFEGLDVPFVVLEQNGPAIHLKWVNENNAQLEKWFGQRIAQSSGG